MKSKDKFGVKIESSNSSLKIIGTKILLHSSCQHSQSLSCKVRARLHFFLRSYEYTPMILATKDSREAHHLQLMVLSNAAAGMRRSSVPSWLGV